MAVDARALAHQSSRGYCGGWVCARCFKIPPKMDAERRFKNSRIKEILERCNDGYQRIVDNNKENQPPLHQREPSTLVSSESPSCGTKNFNKNMTPEELVNCMYAKDYSMTSGIFNKLNETKTSYDLGIDFSHINKTMNADQSSISSSINNISLLCSEVMPPMSPFLPTEMRNLTIPSNNSPIGDFSSDDDVKDKDYCPSEETSSDDDDDNDQSSAKTSRQIETTRTYQETKFIQPQENPFSSNDATASFLEPRPETSLVHLENGPCSSNIASNNIVESCVETSSMQTEAGPSPSKIATTVNESANKNLATARERKLQKQQEKQQSYNVKNGCNEKCLKKCSLNFTSDARNVINKKYWDLSWKERRMFIQNSTAVAIPKRKVTSAPKRAPRSTFHLKNVDGTIFEVCKIFFLTTLGFHKNNDTVLYNSLNKNPVDRRGLHTKTAAFDRKLLTDHVESFQPLEPHYRREHAPLRRYISCDVTVTLMHKNFCEKFPLQKVSYELYRKHVKSMNISFAKLGNEECEVCEAYELHAKTTHHDAAVPEDCEACNVYVFHKKTYKKARDLYETHKKNEQTLENIYFSCDLQKVVKLPRLDGFKSIIFCPRLTVFNQSFAPVGKITNKHKPLACIWHDGTSGRKQEDIMSCYYYFILQYRDVKHITLWMDNCSAQNKNWLLFSLMIFLVNSELIATESITFQYFEPGHTFMSCDQFHHQVEQGMKRKGKLYDFQDFAECVASANQGRADTKIMEPQDFFSFQNLVSERRIQTSTPRVYLKDIIQISFQRKNYDMLYKTEVDEDVYKVFRFMTDRYLKHTDILKPEFKDAPKGIEMARKNSIINALKDICAPHKMQFWHDMPVCAKNVGTHQVNNSRSTL